MDHMDSGGTFGRKTEVQKWDIIRYSLIEVFDTSPDIFSHVIRRSYDFIHGGNPPQTGEQYFTILENNMQPMHMLDFLIALTDELGLHTDMGTVEVANVLRQCKEELMVYRRKKLEDEEEDINFVGRARYISEIKNLLSDTRNNCKGVSICGLGGLGKTSLANKICRDMKRKWDVIRVELREITDMLGVMRAIFMELGCQERTEETAEEILDQIIQFLTDQDRIRKRTIIMLDNVDDVLNTEKSKFNYIILDEFGSFLQSFGDECKIRLLFTSRMKLDSKFRVVQEKELLPMEPSEAVELFNKSVHNKPVKINMAEKIVKLCGYSPLAITTLCSSIRYGLLNPYTIVEDLKPNSRLKSASGTSIITECLEKTFGSLTPKGKRCLMQLSVFHTASFDHGAAAAVLGETQISPGKYDGRKTQLKILNLQSRHLVEAYDNFQSDVNSETQRQVRFSLHPMVYHLLKSKVQIKPYSRDFEVARDRFVKHFRKVVCKVGEEMSKDCIKGQRILGIDRVHVLKFLEILAEPNAPETRDSLQTMVENRRIHEIANTLLYDDTKWKLIQNCVAHTKESGNSELGYIFWRVCEATMLMDMDRNEEAKKVLDDLESTFDNVRGNELTMAAVIGYFYFSKGRYLLREYQCKEAIQCLKQAADLIRIREVKKDHNVLLSSIFNTIGCAYIRLGDTYLDKSTEYHETALRIITKCSRKWHCVEAPVYIQNLGKCLYRSGVILRSHGNEEEARNKFHEAIHFYDNAAKLDVQMNLHKFDCHAQVLHNRGDAYAALGNFENAEKDVEDAMMLRRRIMSPPHIQITLVTFKMAEVLYKKGVWLYHQRLLVPAINTMYRAVTMCEEVADLIKIGGLPVTHKLYPSIKDLTFKLLFTVQEWKKLRKIRDKYKKFEAGTFQKRIDKRRSIKESTRERLTQKELYALVNSSAAVIHGDNEASSSDGPDAPSSSSSDDNDEDEIKKQRQFMAVKDIIPSYESQQEADVDFSSIFDGSYFKLKKEEEMKKPESDVVADGYEKTPDLLTAMEVDEADDRKDADIVMRSSEDDTTIDDLLGHVKETQQIMQHETGPEMSAPFDTNEEKRKIVRQSSSLDEDVFARPELVPQGSVDLPEDMQKLRDSVITKDRRQAWQASSLESSSLEYSADKDGVVSAALQLEKVKLSHQKAELLKMHMAPTILEEQDYNSDNDNESPETQTNPTETIRKARKTPRLQRQSELSEMMGTSSKRRFQDES